MLLVLPVWLAASFWLWNWWLDAANIGYRPLYVFLTAAMLYEFLFLPSTFLYFGFFIKTPKTRRVIKNQRVALISPCVPAKESLAVIERQLIAMTKVTYPHDSWILDENNNKQVRALAKKYRVKYFTRKGIERYNQPEPPFKAKTKAGNVNAWLHHVRRRRYDYFVQLDVDHVPKPEYLDKVLGYFRDPKVAWVQAPSVYNNLGFWTARGAAEQELTFQGPLQMGFYGHCEMPFIIGSHSTYRMKAIDQINGFQPTRAEDHLNTIALAANGWKGVYHPEIIAEGEGPETLETYLAQQFAWAYSLFQVLTRFSPFLLPKTSYRQKFQALFTQTWYPLWSTSIFILFLIPLISLVSGKSPTTMTSTDFFWHITPIYVGMYCLWRAVRLYRQPSHLTISWRGLLLHAIRWIAIFWAVLSSLFNIPKPYMITPKGKGSKSAPTLNVYWSFLFAGGLSIVAIIFDTLLRGAQQRPVSQNFYAFVNVFLMLAICTVDLNYRYKQARLTLAKIGRQWLKPMLACLMLVLFATTTFVLTPLSYHTSEVLAAAAVPSFKPVRILSRVPPKSLSDHELKQQLSNESYQEHADPSLGLYDPKDILAAHQGYIRHSFVDWRSSRRLGEELLVTKRQGSIPLVTIEPRGEKNGEKLLSDIRRGHYDRRLSDMLDTLKANRQTTYIRFAHEMDLDNLYAWGNKQPENYIGAFRHVVNLAHKKQVDNVKWVWSPAGNSNAAAYYPGDEYVDVVGTTILYDEFWYGQYKPSFLELSRQRYWLTGYKKPVWITEFGVGNDDSKYQKQLIQDAINNYRYYDYSALVYINITDSNTKGPNYRIKDLRVLKSAYQKDGALKTSKPLNKFGLHSKKPSLSLSELNPVNR